MADLIHALDNSDTEGSGSIHVYGNLHFDFAAKRWRTQPLAFHIDGARRGQPCSVHHDCNQHAHIPGQHRKGVARAEERRNQKEAAGKQQVEGARRECPG